MAQISDFTPIDTTFEIPETEIDATAWLNRITKARQKEEPWRRSSKNIIRKYRNDNDIDDTTRSSPRPFSYTPESFNVLWANTQTLAPALFSAMPKPDIRNRYLQNDPIAEKAGDILERVLSYVMDQGKFDMVMKEGILDYLLPGRTIIRVRLESVTDKKEIEKPGEDGALSIEIEEEEISQNVKCERVPWNKWIIDPVDNFVNAAWMAFEHDLTESEFKEFFPDKKLVAATKQETQFEIEPRYEVHEVWYKKDRKVFFIGESQEILKEMDDPFKFEHFWPIATPLLSIKTNDTQIPVPEYTIYEAQAYELNQVSYRITDLVKTCKFIGIYDSSHNNIEDILEANDSQFIPDNGKSMSKGGIKAILDVVDVTPISNVLQQLYIQRDQIKQIIDEVTGISDLLRGNTDPHETATAQNIKSQYAGLRIRDRREAINEFVVELLRMQVEMIANFYPTKQLEEMSGIKLDFSGEPPQFNSPEEMEAYLQEKQEAEAVLEIIRDDVFRDYKIDIETDSTILADMEETSQKRAALITSIVSYFQGMAPLVQGGMIPLETAKTLLMYGLQASKLPRQVTDALELIGTQPQMNQPPMGEPPMQEAEEPMQGQLPPPSEQDMIQQMMMQEGEMPQVQEEQF